MAQEDVFCIHIDDLHDFIDKKLNTEDAQIVKKHLEICETCRSITEGISYAREIDLDIVAFLKEPITDEENKVSTINLKDEDEIALLVKEKQTNPKFTLNFKNISVAASLIGILCLLYTSFPTDDTQNKLSINSQEGKKKQEHIPTDKNKTTAYQYDTNDNLTEIRDTEENKEIIHYNQTKKKNQTQIAKKEVAKKKIEINKKEQEKEELLTEVKIRHFKRTDYAYAKEKEERNIRGDRRGNNILKKRKRNNLNELAKELFIAEKFNYAIDTFKYETTKQPDNWRPVFYLALAYFGNKQYSEAIQSFETILKEEKIKVSEAKKLPLIYFQLAKIYLEIGDREKAEKLTPKLHRYTQRFEEELNRTSSK